MQFSQSRCDGFHLAYFQKNRQCCGSATTFLNIVQENVTLEGGSRTSSMLGPGAGHADARVVDSVRRVSWRVPRHEHAAGCDRI